MTTSKICIFVILSQEKSYMVSVIYFLDNIDLK